MKRSRWMISISSGFILLALASCQLGSTPLPTETPLPTPTAAPSRTATAKPSQAVNLFQETLDSFEMIDPYPAYVMKYRGDYALDVALANGLKSDEDIFRHFETLYHIRIEATVGSLREGKACTGFTASSAAGEFYFGHNEDWEKGAYLVLFTSPETGYASVSISDIDYMLEHENALLATPFYPLAGMNSAGLAVATYSVPYCETPNVAGKPYLMWITAIRLLLDRAASVDEALELLSGYNILIEEYNCLQFLVGDAQGNSAIIEWINGETVAVRKTGDWQAVTNFIQYDAPDTAFKSCQRYQTASAFLETHSRRMSDELGMELLSETSQSYGSGGTQFSVVFNQSRRDLRVVFGRNYENAYFFPVK